LSLSVALSFGLSLGATRVFIALRCPGSDLVRVVPNDGGRAHRPHDVEDAVAVLRAQRGRFDATRTKQVLADLAEVLEDPDLVSRFDAVIRRAR
jgi:hypothetical protein